MLVFGPQVANNLNKTHIVCLIILLKILFENETSEQHEVKNAKTILSQNNCDSPDKLSGQVQLIEFPKPRWF